MNPWKNKEDISWNKIEECRTTEANLKEIIKTYISKDENHILPITTNWFLPEVGKGEGGDGYK